MKTWEWDQVDGELSQVGVELTWESEAAGNTGEGGGNEMVKITIGWGGELEGSEADIVKSLVIKSETLISILNKLMDRKGTVIWLHDGIGHLRGRNDGVCRHNSVRVFLSDLGD